MRTALYKMWIEFCNSQEFVPMTGSCKKPNSSNEFHLEGSVSFNYALHNTPMTYPSPQYNAWRAFKYALDPRMIIMKAVAVMPPTSRIVALAVLVLSLSGSLVF